MSRPVPDSADHSTGSVREKGTGPTPIPSLPTLAVECVPLAGFAVRRRRTAPLAELLQLKAIPRVGLVLRGDVVAPLARLACERDGRSLVTHSYVLASART